MPTRMNWQKFWTTSILVFHSAPFVVTGGCDFEINQDYTNEPLLLRPNRNGDSYDLITLKECKLQIHPNQSLLLACPGKGNYLNLTKDSSNVVKCQAQSNFLINTQPFVPYTKLECNSRPHADLKNTGKKCFKNAGVIIQAGFKVEDSWHPILEICHNTQKSQTHYVKHNLILPTSSCVRTTASRPGFVEAGLYSDLNMAQIYSTQYQLSLFKRLIGSNNVSDYINRDDNKYLARGHLAPDADFPLDAWQTVTYFYINSAPQWQSINAGSWGSLENKVRKVSSKMPQLSVITGTHGVLKIANKEIYLENKKLPVPEYFWKLIHNPADNSCMGFITKNNPFLKRHPQHICEDVCSRYGWNIGSGKLSSGYTYCCEYHHLSRRIQEVPAVRCRSALRFTE